MKRSPRQAQTDRSQCAVHHRKPARSAGFTLVELLIVILVISILIAVGFGAFQQARNTAWKQKARDSARQIATAWNLRLLEDRAFPAAASFTNATGTADEIGFETTTANMGVLNAGRIYLEQSADQRSSGMRDKWLQYFHVRLDTDYDGSIKSPYDNTTAIRANVIVWSFGPNQDNSNNWVVVWQ